jgi:hypothetical protein
MSRTGKSTQRQKINQQLRGAGEVREKGGLLTDGHFFWGVVKYSKIVWWLLDSVIY